MRHPKNFPITFCQTESDQPINDVIDWLIYYKKDYIRINYEDFVTKIFIDKSNIKLYFKNKEPDFNKVTSFWNRRRLFNYEKLTKLNNTPAYQMKHLINEWKNIENFIHFKLSQKKKFIYLLII
jgi:hypothetical protein